MTQEEVKKIKKRLPHGAVTKIAEKTGLSRQTVSQVLSGSASLTPNNKIIIDEAKKIIREFELLGKIPDAA